MDEQILQHLSSGGSITFELTGNVIMSLKRSPRGIDCWWAEHQYGVKYTLHEQFGDRLFFNVPLCDGGVRKTGWWINKKSGSLFVLATHNMGDRIVEYLPKEYAIKRVMD